MTSLKRIASKLPPGRRYALRRRHFARQIRRNKFSSAEPEFSKLAEFVRPGDWVLDIGANVGHYTKRLSDIVGRTGRVIAFEPV